MARPHGLQMASAGWLAMWAAAPVEGLQVELGELRRVKEGVPRSDGKRQMLSTPAPEARSSRRHAQDAGHEGHQSNARRGHGRCRVALAAGGVGAVHRP